MLQTGEFVDNAMAWASHDPAWAVLVTDYRAFLAASPDLAPLLQPGVAQQQLAGPGWPYIPAAPLPPPPNHPNAALHIPEDPADPTTQPWPLISPNLGVATQEGLLSQSPLLFARLQEMILRWRGGLQLPPQPLPPMPRVRRTRSSVPERPLLDFVRSRLENSHLTRGVRENVVQIFEQALSPTGGAALDALVFEVLKHRVA